MQTEQSTKVKWGQPTQLFSQQELEQAPIRQQETINIKQLSQVELLTKISEQLQEHKIPKHLLQSISNELKKQNQSHELKRQEKLQKQQAQKKNKSQQQEQQEIQRKKQEKEQQVREGFFTHWGDNIRYFFKMLIKKSPEWIICVDLGTGVTAVAAVTGGSVFAVAMPTALAVWLFDKFCHEAAERKKNDKTYIESVKNILASAKKDLQQMTEDPKEHYREKLDAYTRIADGIGDYFKPQEGNENTLSVGSPKEEPKEEMEKKQKPKSI